MLVAYKLPVLVDTFHFHRILSVVGILIIQAGIFETQGLGLFVRQGDLCQFGEEGMNAFSLLGDIYSLLLQMAVSAMLKRGLTERTCSG